MNPKKIRGQPQPQEKKKVGRSSGASAASTSTGSSSSPSEEAKPKPSSSDGKDEGRNVQQQLMDIKDQRIAMLERQLKEEKKRNKELLKENQRMKKGLGKGKAEKNVTEVVKRTDNVIQEGEGGSVRILERGIEGPPGLEFRRQVQAQLGLEQEDNPAVPRKRARRTRTRQP